MSDQQLDLFFGSGIQAERPLPQRVELPATPTVLDDQALIDAIPGSNLSYSMALAAEAGRRRLAGAVPSLEMLCRRFSGFGMQRMVPEQAAALQALAAIGGREAAQAVSRLIVRAVVQGPALDLAMSTAARIGSVLPADVLRSLLRHPNPGIRSSACGCARRHPELIAVMIELLEDLNQGVARSAACALGQIGRIEARPMLAKLLRVEPSEEIIDAVSSIANEECIVELGRLARTQSALSEAALNALESIDQPRADAIATAIRNARGGQGSGHSTKSPAHKI
ncbi:MAG: HEAT repeat domain-containing protein [Bradyrhizobiaceae bacterium]|nr:HEAT repeat domain-containing protein [Bradyrhizobiaceae bacterium]